MHAPPDREPHQQEPTKEREDGNGRRGHELERTDVALRHLIAIPVGGASLAALVRRRAGPEERPHRLCLMQADASRWKVV